MAINENYIQYEIRISNDGDLNKKLNLIGFNIIDSALLKHNLLDESSPIFSVINKDNSKIYINGEELNPFSLWYKFQSKGKYNIKIEINEKLNNLSFLLYKLRNVTKIDLSHLNTDEVKSLEGTFEECLDLEELNLENINAKKMKN